MLPSSVCFPELQAVSDCCSAWRIAPTKNTFNWILIKVLFCSGYFHYYPGSRNTRCTLNAKRPSCESASFTRARRSSSSEFGQGRHHWTPAGHKHLLLCAVLLPWWNDLGLVFVAWNMKQSFTERFLFLHRHSAAAGKESAESGTPAATRSLFGVFPLHVQKLFCFFNSSLHRCLISCRWFSLMIVMMLINNERQVCLLQLWVKQYHSGSCLSYLSGGSPCSSFNFSSWDTFIIYKITPTRSVIDSHQLWLSLLGAE